MSTGDLKSIGKLTTRIHDSALTIQTQAAFERIADEIEQEITERYTLRPLGADGVPIHIGDTLEGAPGSKWDGERFEVGGIELTAYGWEVCDAETCDSIAAGQTRHVKPRTLEDVLRECCNEWNEHCGNGWESGVYAKYAEEIRGMMA